MEGGPGLFLSFLHAYCTDASKASQNWEAEVFKKD